MMKNIEVLLFNVHNEEKVHLLHGAENKNINIC